MNKKNALNSIKKIEGIDVDLSDLTNQVNTLETQHNGLKTKHDSFETSITSRVNGVEGRVTTLETNIENSASSSDLSNLTNQVNELETQHNELETQHNGLKTKHDSFETSITDRVEGIDNALKHLVTPMSDEGTYVATQLDGTPVLCGVVQKSNGVEFTNDLSEKVPNGEVTRGELLGNIFDTAVAAAMSEEGALSEIIQGLATLYAMENGADHDKWYLVFNQVCTQCLPDFWVSLAEVTFNRTEKKLSIQVQFIMYSSIHYDFSLEAKLDTYEVTSMVALHPTSALLLNTENTVEYTPTADYHPATKKYVDDKCATAGGSAGGIDPVVYYVGEVIEPTEADGELEAQETVNLTITNDGKLNRKVNLGEVNATDIQLDFKYTTPTNAPTIASNDAIEVSVEAFLYINDSLSNVNVNFGFYEDGISADDNMYLFQGGTTPTFEAGHQYQIFISYYVTSHNTVGFATIGAIDFSVVGNSAPTGN